MNNKINKSPLIVIVAALCLIIAGCSGGAVDAAQPLPAQDTTSSDITSSDITSSDTTAVSKNPAGSVEAMANTENSMSTDDMSQEDMANLKNDMAEKGSSKEEMANMGKSMGMSQEDMMKMGERMGMSQEDMNNMGNSAGSNQAGSFSDPAPKLKNLLIQNLGPWDSSSSTFGDLKFNSNYAKTVFDDFGMLHNPGQSDQYDNPTFEFKAPADSTVIAPVSGVVTQLKWQPTSSYKQDDWELVIASSKNAKWGINIDHVMSIDCDRSGKDPVYCDSPLTINGEVVVEGTKIEAGQVIGYVGNWPDISNSGINGRTELTVFEYVRDNSNPGGNYGVINHCPTMYLDESVASVYKTKIQNLMNSYESWSGKTSVYPQNEMVSPGCRYTAIEEDENQKTIPVV